MPRTPVLVLAAITASVLLAPSMAAAQVPPDAKRTADKLTGDEKGAAANNPQCKLFTPAEVAKV